MPAQEHAQRSIQEANEKERHIWRHTRWLLKGLQIAIFLYLFYPIALWMFSAI